MKIGRNPLKPFEDWRLSDSKKPARKDSISNEESKHKKVRTIANKSFGTPLDTNYSRNKI